MGSSAKVLLTKLIQDSVLKLTTANVLFKKTLEIDGIICISTGEEEPEIVVKMHRTIVKPQAGPEATPSPWQPSPADTFTPQRPQRHLANVPQFPPTQEQYMNYDPGYTARSPLTSTPGSLGQPVNKHPPRPAPGELSPAQTNVKPPSQAIDSPSNRPIDPLPGATNIKAEPPDSAAPSTSATQDTTSTSILGKHKPDITQPDSQYAHTPEKLIKTEKEEPNSPITIELDDDDDEEDYGGEDSGQVGEDYDDVGEEGSLGASWMGDESYDNSVPEDGEGAMGQPGGGDMTSVVHVPGADKPSSQLIPQARYLCEQCKMYFTKEEHLEQHNKLCHAVAKEGKRERKKTQQCPLCRKCFRSLCELKRHEMIHSGHQPYKCPYCPRKFNLKANKKTHILRIHGVSE